ncbi:MAG: alanine--tRNA ligase [Saprospiraceae bacterium]|nr:alanine--tRNA ligase [Saprospiraceae bacterium]
MDSRQIRRKFLQFFEGNQHKIVPSAPIVVKNDPTLMFTNAGMNQFKDYFLGNQVAPYTRVADTQKCLRVSGKHNDLEEVGTDGTHHTMFEMLGNWSFGDYFKEEAISLAWKLLTEEYKLDKERIFITVFGGDEKDGLERDNEAYEFWKKWVPEERIIYCGKKDNFWEMGESGPCGPCSEIHVDLRPDEEFTNESGAALVNQGVPEVMEIWNLVFIQYERKTDGKLVALTASHVDTGMGFERLCMVLQKKKATYDTDIFFPMIQYISSFSGIPYLGSYDLKAKSDIAMRVLVDHIRAICFTIADGSLPSNTGSGYVIRRILRRAVRYYYSFLNIKEPFMYRLVPILSNQLGDFFPELKNQIEFIVKVIREEENAFLKTLEDGLKKLDNIEVKNNTLSGQIAFELYDTYGFPIDLTELIAAEKNWTVDKAEFDKALLAQKERSRADAKKTYSDWNIIRDGSTKFVGYDVDEVDEALLLRWRQIETKGETKYQLVLNTTPFYPEGGGQIGDQGILYFDGTPIEVIDTVKENDLILHITEVLPQKLTATIRASINGYRRKLIENNHSATHLLHSALRKIVGTHVQQKGSLVHQDYLRFDFSHFQKLTREELQSIEKLVNEKIRENIQLSEKRSVPIEEAQKSGAMMLFGEKYGEKVRMITFDSNYSVELCGGCHVSQTGVIGYFKIVSESAVAAGVRRIEAISSSAAENWLIQQLEEFDKTKQLLNNPKDLSQQVQNLIDQNKELQKALDEIKGEMAMGMKGELIKGTISIQGIKVLCTSIENIDSKTAKNLIYAIGKELEHCVIVLGYKDNDKPNLMCYITEELVSSQSLNASHIIRAISKHIDGGGGGQPFFATAGGKKKEGIEAAVLEAKSLIENSINK